MNWFIHLFFTLIMAYVSVTTTIATAVVPALPTVNNFGTTSPAAVATTVPVPHATTSTAQPFASVPSNYQPIPRILIDNTPGQQASVITSLNDIATTHNPIDALVNIYCIYTTKTYERITTGTGFFIDKTGIILTNAHVAQFLLLQTVQGATKCIVRTGNPAAATYTADLLYISPTWVLNNANLISQDHPAGTGERDYALLYVTGGINNNPMPNTFPALAINTDEMTLSAINQTVTAAGYPAATAFASGNPDAPLTPKEASSTIKDIMTFGKDTGDLISIGGTDIGEQGASGGPISNSSGQAIGLISTKGDDTLYGTGSLRGLTLAYVDRTIKEETGYSLLQNLGGNLPYRSALFKQTLTPFLQHMLAQQMTSSTKP